MRVDVLHKSKDEPSLIPLFTTPAYDECIELQVQPKDIWLSKVITGVMSYDRIEITVADSGAYVGGCILVRETHDMHVGECLTVLTQYVVPEYRNKGVSRLLMREARIAAHNIGAKVLAYSHRVKPYVYQTIYKVNP